MSDSQKREFEQHYPYVKSHGGSVLLMKRANEYRTIANRFTTKAASFELDEPVLKLNGPLDEPDIGSDRGAFRHAYWSALLYKNDKEKGHIITDAHETWNISAVPAKDMRTTFDISETFTADNYVDELNNRVGRNVAYRYPNASNKELAQLIIMEFRIHGLYRLKKQGNQLKIYRSTLNKTDYESLFNRFGTLSNDGKDPKDKK